MRSCDLWALLACPLFSQQTTLFAGLDFSWQHILQDYGYFNLFEIPYHWDDPY